LLGLIRRRCFPVVHVISALQNLLTTTTTMKMKDNEETVDSKCGCGWQTLTCMRTSAWDQQTQGRRWQENRLTFESQSLTTKTTNKQNCSMRSLSSTASVRLN